MFVWTIPLSILYKKITEIYSKNSTMVKNNTYISLSVVILTYQMTKLFLLPLLYNDKDFKNTCGKEKWH